MKETNRADMHETHAMIGYQWTVYHRHSSHESDGILASGITDDPGKAKSLVEMILAEVEQAAWGLLLRVALDSLSSFLRPTQTATWPPAGEVQVCRRAGDGSFHWGPLFPNDWAEAQHEDG
jgi:hypothetical protein